MRPSAGRAGVPGRASQPLSHPSQYQSFYTSSPSPQRGEQYYVPAAGPSTSPPISMELEENQRASLIKSSSLGLGELMDVMGVGSGPLGRRPQADGEQEEYGKLKAAIQERFATTKLNIRRAEIYLRVQKKALQAMQLYREMILYIVFVLLFFTLVLHVVSVDTSYYQYTSLVGPSWLNVNDVPTWSNTFAAIDNPKDFMGWIRDKLLTVMDPAAAQSDNKMYLWYRKQIGAIRIRQIRSLPSDCSAINPQGGFILQPYKCYDNFPNTLEERGVLQGTQEWHEGYTIFDPAPGSLRDAFLWSYGTGGYAVDIPAGTLAATKAALDALEASGWMSEATRAVRVSINLQNPHTHTIIVGQFNVEFPVTGASIPSVSVDTLHASPLKEPLTLVVAVVVGLACVVYLVNEFRQMRAAGLVVYVTDDKWNVLDLLNLALIVAILAYLVSFHYWSDRMVGQLAGGADPKVFYRLDEGVVTMRTIVQLAGAAILLSCVRVYKFFELNPKLALLTNTVGKALPDLLAFLVIFVILFAGYALMGWIIFGHRLEMFKSFRASFANLFGSLGGLGGLAQDMSEAAPGIGMFYYVSFVVIVSLILVNIFIAIVGKYYAEAGADAVRREEEFNELISPEDRLNPLAKLNRARVDVRPSGAATKFTVAPGQIVRVWLSAEMKRNHERLAATHARPPPGGSPVVSRPPGPSGRRASGIAAMTHYDADSVGSRTAARCMMDVLMPGSEVWMQGVVNVKTGLLGYVGTFRVAQISAGFLDLTPKANAVEIGEASYFVVSRRTYVRALVDMYILDPMTVQRRRISNMFGDYGLAIPDEPCVDDAAIEREIIAISDNNTRLEGKVGAGQDAQIAAPRWMKRRSYHLDEMLAIIRKLERFAEEHHSKKVVKTLAPLVEEAVNIDALYRSVASEGKANVAEHLEILKLESATSAKSITARISKARQAAAQQRGYAAATSRAIAGAASVYSTLMEAAEEFDRRCQEIYLNVIADDETANDRDGDGELDVNYIRRSLRFDQVTDVIRDLALGSGASEVVIKKETMRFLASFPASCFETLNPDREKLRIFIPKPYDTKTVMGTPEDPAILLREARFNVPVTVQQAAPIAASPSLYQGSVSQVPGVQMREGVDMVDLLGILIQDAWALDKVRGGWRYGSKRNDEKKEHPLLKPYFELTEAQRDTNSTQGLQTLRAAVCCGYELVPPKHGAAPARVVQPAKGWEQYRSLLAPGYIPLECVEDTTGAMTQPIILELIDLLARNTHDLWAKEKKSQGYTFGNENSDELLTHKDLMPYDCLDMKQRKSNKDSVEAVLRLLLACGWTVAPARSGMTSGFFQKSLKQVQDLVRCG